MSLLRQAEKNWSLSTGGSSVFLRVGSNLYRIDKVQKLRTASWRIYTSPTEYRLVVLTNRVRCEPFESLVISSPETINLFLKTNGIKIF